MRWRIYGLAALLVIAAFVVAYQFVEPAPPRHIVMASGPEGGAYRRYAEQYRAALAAEGIDLELRSTEGSAMIWPSCAIVTWMSPWRWYKAA